MSFNYRSVGVNIEATPRVTLDGDIILDLSVESSTRGGDVNISGQNLPSFGSRKVTTRMRLRDGESNLLAGLLRDDERKSLTGFPGAIHVPILKQLFSSNDNTVTQTDIVMLMTPHIIRTQGLTEKDFKPIYIGTAANPSLGGGPPPLIAPTGDTSANAPALQPAAAGGAQQALPPGAAGVGRPTEPAPPTQQPAPAMPRGGIQPVPQLPAAPPMGAQPPTSAAPPGAQPQPVAPPAGAQAPAAAPQPGLQPQPAAPASGAQPQPAAPPPGAQAPPPGAGQAATAPATATAPPTGTASAQVAVTPPGTQFSVGGGPYTVPISITNVNRVTTVSLSLTFNPAAVRVRSVQEGSFMRQGGSQVAFAQQVDPATGRIDITLSRTGDTVGATGSGVLASLIFDAVAPGAVTFAPSGVASGPGGAIGLQFSPATVTVK